VYDIPKKMKNEDMEMDIIEDGNEDEAEDKS
jgi:hypothetical protein